MSEVDDMIHSLDVPAMQSFQTMTARGPNFARNIGRIIGRAIVVAIALAAMLRAPEIAAADEVKASGVKLVLIGATSRTAGEIIPQALALGHQVVGVARRPEEITLKHNQLRTMKGDVLDIASLEAALHGDEVVISMVGPAPIMTATEFKDFGPTNLMSQGTANIIQAMKKKGNKRLIVASSSLAEIVMVDGPPPADAPPHVRYMWSMRTAYQDERDMEAVVRVSGLDTVILRPGFIVSSPARHDLQLAITDQGRGNLTPKRTIITYADLAELALKQVVSNEYIGKTIGIYSNVCPKGTTLETSGCVNR